MTIALKAILSVIALWMMIPGSAAAGDPPTEVPPGLESVVSKSKASGKLLIVGCVSESDSHSAALEVELLKNQPIAAWLESNAIYHRLDIDRFAEVARKHGVRSPPTVLAFRDGELLDRNMGLNTKEEFLEWLHGLPRGEKRGDVLARKRLRGGLSPMDRLDLAVQLLIHERYDDSLIEQEWLWNNLGVENPDHRAYRGSVLVNRMRTLAERYEPARVRFRELRDQLQEQMTEAPDDRATMLDWLALNRVIGDETRVIEWIDTVMTRPDRRQVLKSLPRSEVLSRVVDERVITRRFSGA